MLFTFADLGTFITVLNLKKSYSLFIILLFVLLKRILSMGTLTCTSNIYLYIQHINTYVYYTYI